VNSHLLFDLYTICSTPIYMGGLGLCLCCKKDKLLTEHHDKEIKEKVMICRDCHNLIEEYLKLVEKYSNFIPKDRQALVDKGSSMVKKDDNTSSSSEKELSTVEPIVNNNLHSTSDAADIADAAANLPDEQVQALKEIISEYKKSDKTSTSESNQVLENEELEQPRKRQKGWLH